MVCHCCTATLHYHQSYSHNLTQYFVFLLFCFLCLPHPFFHTIKSPPTKGFLKISTSTKKSPLAQIFTRRPTHCCHRLTHTEPSVLCCVNALAHSQSPPLAPGKELVISLPPAARPWFTNPLIGAIRPISGFERFRLRGKEWSTIEDGCRGKVVHDEHIKDGNWWVKTCDSSAGFLWLQLDQASQNYSQDTLVVGALLLKSQMSQTKFSTHSMLFTFCCQKQLEGRKRTQLHNYNAKWPHIWKQRGSNADIEKNCNSLFCLKSFFEEDIFCSWYQTSEVGPGADWILLKYWICWTPWPDLLNTRTFMSSSIYNVLKCQFWHYFKTSQQ